MTNEEFLRSISLDGEKWRNIAGYEGMYAVSSFGRCVALERQVFNPAIGRLQTRRFMLIKYSINNRGYYVFHLNKCGKVKHVRVNRLVAEAFVPNPGNLPCVDHIDGDKLNNNADNLRWVTHLENNNNPISLFRLRCKTKMRKTPVVCVRNGVIVGKFSSLLDASKAGFCKSCIIRCLKGVRPHHKGLQWHRLSDWESSNQ